MEINWNEVLREIGDHFPAYAEIAVMAVAIVVAFVKGMRPWRGYLEDNIPEKEA